MNLEEKNEKTANLKKKEKRPKNNAFSKHVQHLLRALSLQTEIWTSRTHNARRQIYQQMFYGLLISLFPRIPWP